MLYNTHIFEKTYKDYIAQVAKIDFPYIEEKLGIKIEGSSVLVPLFEKSYYVDKNGITDSSGKQPVFDICVVICKYLLLCPDVFSTDNNLVSYRDFNDSAPLTGYFSNYVELHIAKIFSGRKIQLEQACKALGGYPLQNIKFLYDLSMRFDALPRVPVFIFYNDKDDEFSASCSVLFEKRATNYLDIECLAILGTLFINLLKTYDN